MEVDSHILSSLSVAVVKKSGGLEYLRKNCSLVRAELLSNAVGLDKFIVADNKKQPTLERGESSKVHISNADNNINNPLGITFKILNYQGN